MPLTVSDIPWKGRRELLGASAAMGTGTPSERLGGSRLRARLSPESPLDQSLPSPGGDGERGREGRHSPSAPPESVAWAADHVVEANPSCCNVFHPIRKVDHDQLEVSPPGTARCSMRWTLGGRGMRKAGERGRLEGASSVIMEGTAHQKCGSSPI